MAIIGDVEAKRFQDGKASDVSNSGFSEPALDILAKNVLDVFSLGIANGSACITVSMQLRIAKEDLRCESSVSELLESGAAVQVRVIGVESCGLGDIFRFPVSIMEMPSWHFSVALWIHPLNPTRFSAFSAGPEATTPIWA